MTPNLAAEMAAALTPAQAAEADLTVQEVIGAKVDEMSVILRETSPTTPVEQDHADWLIRELSTGWPAAVLAGLIALVPRVETGETCGAYGERLAEALRD
jgi:hypothetical protein